jgi:two-component system sensor histidine kinase DegS
MRDENITILSEILEHMIKQKKDSNINSSNTFGEELDKDILRLERILSKEHERKRTSNTHKEALAILQIQEDERRRVAMELHDESLQNLAYLTHKIELSIRYVDSDPEKAKAELELVGTNLRSVINEMRNIIFNLRPVDLGKEGLRGDLEHLAFKLNEQNLFFVSTDIDDIEFHDNVTLVSIYRIVKECLMNAFKHSNGNQLLFTMKQKEDTCVITIKDNGVGFDFEQIKSKARKHFGLSVLQERVRLLDGVLDIESEVGVGTTITIYIPYVSK